MISSAMGTHVTGIIATNDSDFEQYKALRLKRRSLTTRAEFRGRRFSVHAD